MIAILGALEDEIEAFESEMNGAVNIEWNGRRVSIGSIIGKDAVAVWTGTGKVFAALTTQYIIDTYHPDAVFFVGIAGSLHSGLDIGDIVVAQECIQYDFDITAFGFKPGEIPFSSGSSLKKGKRKSIQIFKTDKELIEMTDGWHYENCSVKTGRILTGDSFIRTDMLKEDRLNSGIKELSGDAVEMEGGAAAQVCFENGVPFFLARVISDTPDGVRVKNFRRFLSESSAKLYSLITYIIEHWNT